MSEDWTAGGGGGGQAIDGNSNINSSNSRRRINACQFCRLHATAVVAAATSHQTMMIFARICHQCCPPIRTETRFSCFLPLHISLLREWGRERCAPHTFFHLLSVVASGQLSHSLPFVRTGTQTDTGGRHAGPDNTHTFTWMRLNFPIYIVCVCVCV